MDKLGTIQNVPVMDYAPGNLGRRFAALMMTVVWRAVAAMNRSAEVSTFFNLLAKLTPVLVLHDSRDPKSQALAAVKK